jgi:ATP-dependent Zn protease
MNRIDERHRRRDQIAAYHEAGHVVMAVMNRIPLRDATILRSYSTASAGTTRLNPTGAISRQFSKKGKLGEREYKQILRRALFDVAGEVAERRYAPHSWRTSHSRSDLESISRLLESIDLSGPRLRTVATAIAIIADEVVGKNWPRVEAVAEALLQRRTVTGAEVRRIVKLIPTKATKIVDWKRSLQAASNLHR